MMRGTFYSRVLVVFVALIFFAQLAIAITTFIAANQTALGLARNQLDVGHSVTQQILQARAREFAISMRALAADFAFREAITSGSSPTILSALANQGARINADLAYIVGNDGRIISSTDESTRLEIPTAISPADKSRREVEPTLSLVKVKERVLQIVSVKIRAPDEVGTIFMGFVVDDAVLRQIKNIAGVDVTVLAMTASDVPALVASTLPLPETRSMAADFRLWSRQDGVLHTAELNHENYLYLVAPLQTGDADHFSVVLQAPKSTVMAPLLVLRRQLMWACGLVTLLAVLAAMLSARLLSRPVRALANAARSLQLVKRASADTSAKGDCELANIADAFHALAQRAHYDSLTGLPNRALIRLRITQNIARALKKKSTFSIVFIDLNGFKKINDEMGHELGDLVLRKIAQRLLRSLGPTDVVARLGGDEFVLLFDGIDHADAIKRVDQLMPVISTPMVSPRGPIQVGMSAGIASFPYHARTRDDLLRLADEAMYQSKTRRLGPVIATAPNESHCPSGRSPAQPTDTHPIEPNVTGTWESDVSKEWKDRDLATQRTVTIRGE